MATVGRALLIIALGVSLYGVGASLYGARTGRRAWVDSGRRAMYALAGVLTLAFAILIAAFLRSDFSFAVVASHSSTTTPTLYRAAASWSSQEGSLLLWVWLLAVWSSLVLYGTRRKLREIAPYATAVLFGFAAFFSVLVVFMASPFEVLARPPVEGTGLSPLLRHASMMIHPPMLYSGYTLFSIPFAFAVGALVTRRTGAEWVKAMRRFALGAWLCLGIGILLGARWSYTELGWGGYWAWDPVENAALLPWLTGTAYLHSVMIQEKRGMLKVWNASLILGTGVLSIVGTFLVRSGILSSIHAFVEPGAVLRWSFVGLIALMMAGSVALVLSRRHELRTENRLDSLLSREAFFLGQNLLLLGLCLVVFWGTFFPLISEAVTGTKSSIGPPWYGPFVAPLALCLVALMGIGPVIAWRRGTATHVLRNVALPAAVAAVAAVALLLAGAAGKPVALLMLCFSAFVVACVGQELWRGTGARRAMTGEGPALALLSLVRRNRRRYGGYLVHVGIAVVFMGVAASSAFQHREQVDLRPGQSATVGGYTFRYVRPTSRLSAERVSLGAVLDVSRGGRHVATLDTAKGYYPSLDAAGLGTIGRFFDGEPETQVGLRAGTVDDLWTAIEPKTDELRPLIAKANAQFGRVGPEAQAAIVAALAQHWVNHPPAATFNVVVSPLVTWIWIGGVIVLLAALLAIWPPAPPAARRRVSAAYAARLGRELRQT